MILVSIGIQGSGKGTQARILEDKYGFKLYETGGALREISNENSNLGKLVKETIEAGKQVSPEIVEDILIDIIENKNNGKLILDGFVRNKGNKESVDNIVKDFKVLYFNLSKEDAITRLCGRMYDKETGETFPAGTTTNPKTGNALEKRTDDNEASIMTRIEQYYEKTVPIIEEYRKEGKLIEIDASLTIEEVTKEIEKKLKL